MTWKLRPGWIDVPQFHGGKVLVKDMKVWKIDIGKNNGEDYMGICICKYIYIYVCIFISVCVCTCSSDNDYRLGVALSSR